MTPNNSRILVAGATGMVGGLVVRKLLSAGVPVRALGRNPVKLAALAAAGAETVAADLLDGEAVTRACGGIGQIYSTANNVMGRGACSPNRIDVKAYESLCNAARATGVRRIVHLSGRGMDASSPVDFFRIKHAIEEVIRPSGVPFVFIRPGAFMETWVGMMADGIRKNRTAMMFGDGLKVSNLIAIEDVAEFSLRVLQRDDINNEVIDIGGPDNLSSDALVTLLERHFGVSVRRRRIPAPIHWTGGLLLRPFNEVVSRMMLMGYFSATRDARFADWEISAKRFNVSPMSVEAFVRGMPLPPGELAPN